MNAWILLPNSSIKSLNPLGKSEQWSEKEAKYTLVEIPPYGTHIQTTVLSPCPETV